MKIINELEAENFWRQDAGRQIRHKGLKIISQRIAISTEVKTRDFIAEAFRCKIRKWKGCKTLKQLTMHWLFLVWLWQVEPQDYLLNIVKAAFCKGCCLYEFSRSGIQILKELSSICSVHVSFKTRGRDFFFFNSALYAKVLLRLIESILCS